MATKIEFFKANTYNNEDIEVYFKDTKAREVLEGKHNAQAICKKSGIV